MTDLSTEKKIPGTGDLEIYDASTFSGHHTLETDVVIIGSGAGGGVTAEILARSGIKTIVVEEGPYRDSKSFRMRETEAYPDLYQESAARKTRDKTISIYQGRCVGGSTTINWTSSFRTPAATLRHWQTHYELYDLNEKSLRPWFEMMEKRLNIIPWSLPANTNNDILARGSRSLGISYGAMKRNVKGCANLGYCGMGCPIDAKQSMLVSTIPSALSSGAKLITRLRAQKLTSLKDKVKELRCSVMNSRGTHTTNKELKIQARYFVVSSGSMGSPALLMRSEGLDPYRLAGKRTFLHPVCVSAAVFPFPVNGYYGAPQSVYSDHFLEEDASGPIGFKLEVAPIHPILTAVTLRQTGKEFRRLMKSFPKFHVMLALMRDGFHPESTGGDVVLLSDGTPALDYNITPYMWRGFRRAYKTMADIQWAAGARGVMPVHDFAELSLSQTSALKALQKLPMQAGRAKIVSAHVMGGCKMGQDPDHSIVDVHGRHHLRENLFVIDASVFPTSIGANPQLSIYALSARNASNLRDEIKHNHG